MTMQARQVLQRAGMTVPVEPGPPRVIRRTGPSLARWLAAERVSALRAAPGTRVPLVAGRATSLAGDRTARVDHQEPVPDCTVPRG